MGCDRHSTILDPCYLCRLEQEMTKFMPRDPRWRYWTDERGWMYGWTTERMGDGKFAAFMMKPYGTGARSGRRKVTQWVKVRETHFMKRSTAKARAAKWFNTRNPARTITV